MRFLDVSSVLVSLALAACGGSPSSPTVSTTPNRPSSNPSCPVAVAGTSVSVEDVPAGASLVFVTTGDVTELRRRVSSMASMHNDQHGAMGPLPGDHAGHDMSGHAGHDMQAGNHAGHAGGMIGVHSKATSSDIDGGAKITFTAAGSDIAKLQTELRKHAQHLASGTCGMAKS